MEKVKKILLAAFVTKSEIDQFLVDLDAKFQIPSEKTFLYQLTDDIDKYIITFRLTLIDGKRIDLRKHFNHTIPIHKKGDAIYTINALNRLIEIESGADKGNINYKDFTIDWSAYQGKLILLNNDNLAFLNILRIFKV